MTDQELTALARGELARVYREQLEKLNHLLDVVLTRTVIRRMETAFPVTLPDGTRLRGIRITAHVYLTRDGEFVSNASHVDGSFYPLRRYEVVCAVGFDAVLEAVQDAARRSRAAPELARLLE